MEVIVTTPRIALGIEVDGERGLPTIQLTHISPAWRSPAAVERLRRMTGLGPAGVASRLASRLAVVLEADRVLVTLGRKRMVSFRREPETAPVFEDWQQRAQRLERCLVRMIAAPTSRQAVKDGGRQWALEGLADVATAVGYAVPPIPDRYETIRLVAVDGSPSRPVEAVWLDSNVANDLHNLYKGAKVTDTSREAFIAFLQRNATVPLRTGAAVMEAYGSRLPRYVDGLAAGQRVASLDEIVQWGPDDMRHLLTAATPPSQHRPLPADGKRVFGPDHLLFAGASYACLLKLWLLLLEHQPPPSDLHLRFDLYRQWAQWAVHTLKLVPRIEHQLVVDELLETASVSVRLGDGSERSLRSVFTALCHIDWRDRGRALSAEFVMRSLRNASWDLMHLRMSELETFGLLPSEPRYTVLATKDRALPFVRARNLWIEHRPSGQWFPAAPSVIEPSTSAFELCRSEFRGMQLALLITRSERGERPPDGPHIYAVVDDLETELAQLLTDPAEPPRSRAASAELSWRRLVAAAEDAAASDSHASDAKVGDLPYRVSAGRDEQLTALDLLAAWIANDQAGLVEKFRSIARTWSVYWAAVAGQLSCFRGLACEAIRLAGRDTALDADTALELAQAQPPEPEVDEWARDLLRAWLNQDDTATTDILKAAVADLHHATALCVGLMRAQDVVLTRISSHQDRTKAEILAQIRRQVARLD
jgi:hypothetical protein